MTTASIPRRWLFGVLPVVLIAGAYYAARWLPSMWAEPAIPTHTVESTHFVRTVSAEGNLRAVKATPLTTPRRTRQALKIAWLAGDGSRVEKGDVVARFDATEMEKQLADGLAALTTAERKLAKQRIEIRNTQAERDRASEMTAMELEQTRKFQPKNDQIFSRNEIIESEIDGELSQARLDHARSAKSIERELSRSKLDILAIEKRVARMQVEQAKAGLNDLVITAPHAGIVVLERDWNGNEVRVGDQVWPGQAVAELPHVESMEAEVFVLEADAGGLKDGLRAEVVIEAHPDRRFGAEVARVDKLAKPRVPNVPVQYFGVTLKLDETAADIMKPGQRVRATLTLDEREALVVPRPAIFYKGGDKDGPRVVYRQTDDGEFEPVEVEIGATSLGLVVIDKGLSAGDRIALRDPTGASDSDDGAGAGDESSAAPAKAAMGGGR